MKRKLDDIELEEIQHFYIDQTTLIVKTTKEENSYSYPNSLELLRRLGYMLHRYEVEFNRIEDQKTENSDILLTPIQKKCQKRLMISRNIVFGVYAGYIFLKILFPNASSTILQIFMAIDSFILGNAVRDAYIMKREAKKRVESKQNNESQFEKGFQSLKEASLSYLNKLTKVNAAFTVDEKHYIEVIEKGFQKRIGTYPQ